MRSISRCLNKQLTDLCQRSMQLEDLSTKVAQLLPPPLAAACHVGSFNKGCLVLITNNAAWASQLRYSIPELRDKLRKESGMYQLLSIKVTIADAIVISKKTVRNTGKNLSEKAKASIISESEHCNYQPLKKALLQLADADQSL